MKTNPDTIAAIATPGGRGGIGIIKISGSRAIPIAKSIFKPVGSRMVAGSNEGTQPAEPGQFEFESHRLYHGHIVDPYDERLLDEVLVSAMRAPHTYTREDVAEINAHGGAVAVQSILQLVIRKGARLAEPGEFTRRAFLNGRIDLTQAESVIDVINARTQKSLELAAAQMTGKLREQVSGIRDELIEILARVEAAIDFPDDVEELVDPEDATETITRKVLQPLRGLIRNYIDAHVFRDGLSVAVVGRPNVGKSSLLNRLVEKDRAIVTEIPGTTRDVIEETLNLNGLPVIISDTAGVHQTDHPIEKIGIEKTLEHVNGSDLVLFMVEAHSPLGAEDHEIYEMIRIKPIIVVLNKIDLVRNGKETDIPASWNVKDRVIISALYNKGIELLKNKIIRSVAGGGNPIDLNVSVVPNLRHKLLIEKSLNKAEEIIKKIKTDTPVDLIAIDLQEAIDTLGAIGGDQAKVDVLDEIFSRFCVGK